MRILAIAGLIFANLALGGEIAEEWTTPGVTPPKLIKFVPPPLTADARWALAQDSAVFTVVVDETGIPTEIDVLSPAGYGMDEAIGQAIQRWRYKPGMKNGVPVAVRCTVQVDYSGNDPGFNPLAERSRTAFNLALRKLKGTEKDRAAAIAQIRRLSKDKYPPAMSFEGKWLLEGTLLPRDLGRARDLLTAAAATGHGPAIYELGRMQLDGEGLPRDPEAGLRQIRKAAGLGSVEAQFLLARRAESGAEGQPDPAAAERYYRMCAGAGQAACQYKLAKLLLQPPAGKEVRAVQAVAWLQAASRQGLQPAQARLATERERLTPKQREAADRLTLQLSHQQ